MSAMPLIQTEDLYFSYPGHDTTEDKKVLFFALNGVSLQVKQGEFVAVVGQNGSGKSTLAKQCNAILTPTKGTVLVCGMDTQDQELMFDIRKEVGMVFQNPDNQLVATLVEEDVAFAPENLGVPQKEIRKRVDDALEAVGMYDLRGKEPHKLSGGQKQRVAIAGILAMQPDCIVFDEATAMLDPQGRKEVMRTMEELHQNGTTIIHITHFMEEAVTADRILVMEEGKLLLEGTPSEVFCQGALLEHAGLCLPQVTQLAQSLHAAGYSISQEIFTVAQCAQAICQLLEAANEPT